MNNPYEVTEDTAVYGFIADTNISSPAESIDSKPITLYLDDENNFGRFASVYFQGNIDNTFSYQLNRNGEPVTLNNFYEAYCGQAWNFCLPDPSFEFCNSKNGQCHNGGGGCVVGTFLKSLSDVNLRNSVPSSLLNLYKFRDSFLNQSERGKNYIDSWYRFSKNLKLIDISDPAGSLQRLINYAQVASLVSQKLDILLNPGNDNAVILDNTLYGQLKGIADNHKGISPEMDSSLNLLIEDMKFLKGKPKQTITSFFNQNP